MPFAVLAWQLSNGSKLLFCILQFIAISFFLLNFYLATRSGTRIAKLCLQASKPPNFHSFVVLLCIASNKSSAYWNLPSRETSLTLGHNHATIASFERVTT